MTDKERLKKLSEKLQLSFYEIAKRIGLKNSNSFTHIKSGKYGISKDLAKQISDTFPEISFGWLLTGAGSMLADENKLDKVIQMDFPDLNKIDEENKIIDEELRIAEESKEKYLSKKELSESEKFILLNDTQANSLDVVTEATLHITFPL